MWFIGQARPKEEWGIGEECLHRPADYCRQGNLRGQRGIYTIKREIAVAGWIRILF